MKKSNNIKNQKETALLQTSFNLINLYPSVSIDEAVAVIIEIITLIIYENERNSHLQIYRSLSN